LRQADRLRVAFVTPFFGRDAHRDDERFLFRFVAELALRGLAIEVMTTCARSAADDWAANYYHAGRDDSETFEIQRFRVEPRDRPAYDAAVISMSGGGDASSPIDIAFLLQGVRSPDLLAHIRRVADSYDAFVFAPYSAATTLLGIGAAVERAIVMPRLDDDPIRFARLMRDRLRPARAFFTRDAAETEALLAILGTEIEPRCLPIGPANESVEAWDATYATVRDAIAALPGLDDGRTREEALAQVAYLYPLVRKQRSLIIGMQNSRFWKLRNSWFDLKTRLGIPGEDTLPAVAPESEAAELRAVGDPYFMWRERNALRPTDIDHLRRMAAVLPERVTFGFLIDAATASVADVRAAVEDMRAQIWAEWRALIVLSAKASRPLRDALATMTESDTRIRVTMEPPERAVRELGTDFVLPFDPGDRLERDLLVEFALSYNVDREAVALYGDEDEIGERGFYRFPFFKPDWSPETILSRDYVGRPCALRSQDLAAAGGLNADYGPAMWFDALLRCTDAGELHVVHVARVLYHRLPRSETARPEFVRKAIEAALLRRKETARVYALPGAGREHFAVRYALAAGARVCIVIPTRDRPQLLSACLESVFARSIYPHFEVLVVDNGSREAATQALFARWTAAEPKRFRVLRADIPFNYSKLNNLAVRETTCEYVVLLNNDTVVLTEDWIEGLLELASKPKIGAVGAMLLYPDDTVQHSGVILGVLGLAGHAHRYASAQAPGYFGALQAPTNYLAVTGACMMVARAKYLEVGGLDERLAVSYNDVDFCFRLHVAGYRNVYLPYVRLYHFESKSRGIDDTPSKVRRANEEVALIRQRWPDFAVSDPYYNPNLTSEAEDFSLRI
jgi:GT2 family glycosyltransferase